MELQFLYEGFSHFPYKFLKLLKYEFSFKFMKVAYINIKFID